MLNAQFDLFIFLYIQIIKNGRGAFKPTSVWGPALQKHREEWIQMKNR